jgi:ribosomal protein L14E/L6E/L27E
LAEKNQPTNLPVVGQLVRSRAGRDIGEYYLVSAVDKKRVSLVDGRKRNLNNPKWKNPVHLQKVKSVSAEFREKAERGKLTPEDIRAIMSAMLKENPDEEVPVNV